MSENIGVLGAGSWGTAAACALARSGNRVMLWSRSPELCSVINTGRINTKYLPGYELPPSVTASADMQEVCRFAGVLFLASPSLYLMDTVERLLSCASFEQAATAGGEGVGSRWYGCCRRRSIFRYGMSCSETKASPDSSNTHPLIAVLTKGFLPDERGEP